MSGVAVWKYPIGQGETDHKMPYAARILDVQWQHPEGPMLWALVDPDEPYEVRRFFVVGTGERFDPDLTGYIGTFQIDAHVWHVFERFGLRTETISSDKV